MSEIDKIRYKRVKIKTQRNLMKPSEVAYRNWL